MTWIEELENETWMLGSEIDVACHESLPDWLVLTADHEPESRFANNVKPLMFDLD